MTTGSAHSVMPHHQPNTSTYWRRYSVQTSILLLPLGWPKAGPLGGATERVPMRRKTCGPESLSLKVLKTKESIDETVDLSKSEIRRQKKEKRRKEWEEFNQTKPGVGYEDQKRLLVY